MYLRLLFQNVTFYRDQPAASLGRPPSCFWQLWDFWAFDTVLSRSQQDASETAVGCKRPAEMGDRRPCMGPGIGSDREFQGAMHGEIGKNRDQFGM
jgi:hypothetical protein